MEECRIGKEYVLVAKYLSHVLKRSRARSHGGDLYVHEPARGSVSPLLPIIACHALVFKRDSIVEYK